MIAVLIVKALEYTEKLAAIRESPYIATKTQCSQKYINKINLKRKQWCVTLKLVTE